MKKGLRRVAVEKDNGFLRFSDRPDEEGIKTRRLLRAATAAGFSDRPDEEGIKTIVV